jgi:hypothetical protein
MCALLRLFAGDVPLEPTRASRAILIGLMLF